MLRLVKLFSDGGAMTASGDWKDRNTSHRSGTAKIALIIPPTARYIGVLGRSRFFVGRGALDIFAADQSELHEGDETHDDDKDD